MCSITTESTTSSGTSSMAIIKICYFFLLFLLFVKHSTQTVWSISHELDNNSSVYINNNRTDSSKVLVNQPIGTGCPNCLSVASNRPLAEKLKVEAIKRQILSKLNLSERPNITAPIPRELVLEALRRAQLDSNNANNNYHPFSPHIYPLNSAQHLQQEYHSTQHSVHQTSYEETETTSNQILGSSGDDYFGKTSEIIAFAEPGSKVNGHTLLVLMCPHDNIHRLSVMTATLWIQIRLKQMARSIQHLLRDHFITLYIFRVIDSGISWSPPNGSNLELITTHKIKANRPGWKHIDIRQAIQKWFDTSMSSTSKLTLLVDCVGCDSLIDIVLFENSLKPHSSPETQNSKINVNSNTSEHTANQKVRPNVRPPLRHNPSTVKNGFRPFVVITTKIKISRRSRRHTLTCDSQTNQCCKQSLYVSFRDLGWDDWIIAPKGYYANYCVGDCSKRRTPDTYVYFHSHVIEEYRNKNPYASITPCCAPTKLSAISLIYFDPELNIIKADLPKMVVEECGCT